MTDTSPTAEILSQGDEVVTGQTVDTNATWLSERLTALGFTVLRHTAVGDRLEDIRDLVREAASRSSVCICTGGLGPTEDDLTAQAVSDAFDRPLALDRPSLERIASFFARVNRPMTDVNRKQAYLPKGAICLNNDWGTAPGFAVDQGSSWLAFMPGVPREMKQMMPHRIEPLLVERFQLTPSRLVTLRTVGIGESMLQERIGPFSHDSVVLSYRTMFPENQIKLRFPGHFPKEGMKELVQEIAGRIGNSIFSIEGLETPGGSLVEVIARELQTRGEHIAMVEVSTGGQLAATCSTLDNWADWFIQSVVIKPDASLAAFGVEERVVAEHGPVSAPVAMAMAETIRTQSGATYGLATTDRVPLESADRGGLGKIHIALATATKTYQRELQVFGDHGRIRGMGATEALNLLRRKFDGTLENPSQ